MEEVAQRTVRYLYDHLVDCSEQHTYNLFYVRDAQGSQYIPAQEAFAVRYGVRSVLGFFGMLPSGNLYTVILFANRMIPRKTTEYFRTLALNVKMAALPFDETAVFATQPARRPPPAPSTELVRVRSRAGSLEQLVSVQEQVVVALAHCAPHNRLPAQNPDTAVIDDI